MNLTENQLIGIIPNKICNQGDNFPTLKNNQLCPPYPVCIEANIGSQETSNCSIELWRNLYPVEQTTELNLFRSKLTVIIPLEIGELINLTGINLSDNHLNSPILSEIGNLVSLKSLPIYNNQISGEIPSEIGNFINLNILQLRNNYFTGVIPISICNLNILLKGNNFFDINEIQFCPPYPFCIEYNIGEQDTTDCD